MNMLTSRLKEICNRRLNNFIIIAISKYLIKRSELAWKQRAWEGF